MREDIEVRVWPPANWCAELNPARSHMCNRPRGHEGDHSGWPAPTVYLDEWLSEAQPDA